ncbi:CidA/LrgA family protein [Gelidibacter salicanalis]|uniref:CidA/LrgA family protein n=2 Tax=Gelidibacter salicanalis TaxID=291193 RepID=A0A5C7AUU6_9FLAO|nr:CidA/LrgA family protein [Gelidibacter salicanalis]
MLKGFLWIFIFLGLGELINYALDIPIPGNILGMLLIFIALKLNIIQLKTLKPASDLLLKYMVLFFVPYGVGLMSYYDFIESYWVILSVAAVFTTLITLYITAIIQQKMERHD